jgi:hypothetical protein
MIWPYEFRDCYRRNSVTNSYDISPTFEQHVSNIKCWGAHMELFKQYPELRGYMMCFSDIPASLAGSSIAQFRYARPRESIYAEVGKKRSRSYQRKPVKSGFVAGEVVDLSHATQLQL